MKFPKTTSLLIIGTIACVFSVLTAGACLAGQHDNPDNNLSNIATFSIVAYDSTTGELGVAVASRFFTVGNVVPWAKAGVGAVATPVSYTHLTLPTN